MDSFNRARQYADAHGRHLDTSQKKIQKKLIHIDCLY